MSLYRSTLLLAALACPLTLPAADLGSLSFLKDAKMGAQVGTCLGFGGVNAGGYFETYLGDGQTLRPRLDVAKYSDKTFGITANITSISLSADYQYHLSSPESGFYLIGGMGMAKRTRTLSSDNSTVNITLKEPGTFFSYSGGAGYRFSRQWGLEVRYAPVFLDGGSLSVSYVF